MNLDAFSLRDVQGFLTLVTVMEAEGATDLRQVRDLLQAYVHDQQAATQAAHALLEDAAATHNAAAVPGAPVCPECGQPTQLVRAGTEAVVACRSCRWSALL